MADHVRTQLRDAAISALTGLATSGSRVYKTRVHAMQDANLPGLRISTANGNSARRGVGAGPGRALLERTVELVVECCAKANADLDDTLDQMLQEVEVAISQNQNLGGAKWIVLRREEADFEGEAESPVGVLRATFEALLLTAQNAPDVAL